MVKSKKELEASSAIWRSAIEEDEDECFEGNLFATPNDSNFNINLHSDNNKKTKKIYEEEFQDSSITKVDSQLSYTFRRNYQFLQNVFSVDTLVKPLPPAMAENVSRNLTFFRRVFTQFTDPDGISNAKKSLGFGREDKFREVR
ncbi:hypothetical protein POM88_002448 [Heracleum sosnowskyi]|uniref:Uncharacterized protein n=1 Tax=Heracleum sosnowskyi TaxID=360622 RepID=A0AAD8NCK2_9APIA|nr:hypothetical protein POM88_002448 [Heracleum sosnowskyi]